MSDLSPMMKQYMDIKENHKDHIVFFRLGDFYEMFFDDAILASEKLDLTLTGRDCGMKEKAPMCGIPYHSSEAYIKRLIKQGYKVAICDQIEPSSQAKGIVKREVVRVISQGTLIEDDMLDESINNYIASIYLNRNSFSISFSDISTGDVYYSSFKDEINVTTTIINELLKFSPVEMLINRNCLDNEKLILFIKDKLTCVLDIIEDDVYNYENLSTLIIEHIKKNKISNSSISLEDENIEIYSIGSMLSYLSKTQKEGVNRIVNFLKYEKERYLYLDIVARRNLELTETMITKEKKGSLLWVLDSTKTFMGKRCMRNYIEQPIVDIIEIKNRQYAVKELYLNHIKRDDIRSVLSKINDVERLMTKIIYLKATPLDVYNFFNAIKHFTFIKDMTNIFDSHFLKSIHNDIYILRELEDYIFKTLNENPSNSLKDGNIVKPGVNKDLDEYRKLLNNTKEFIQDIEDKEKEKTGIKNLKVKHNKIFGYYIEITKSNLENIPEDYIRKQTLSNCERFITMELKNLETKVLYANDKIGIIESEIYHEVLSFISDHVVVLQKTTNAISRLDVMCSFAEVAVKNNYCCPEILQSGEIIIKDGRHPVVELLLSEESFVPNNTILDNKNDKILLITGPNMSGKSTYMRQTAIITFMAHLGSFVPAKEANISIVDKIFTRVGAYDNLSTGQSTFMMEMTELSSILKTSTQNSLIILDEIGRGTSTFDGMSIARATIEYIVNNKKHGCKTLFATHYHELIDLEEEYNCVKNYSIEVRKVGEDISFLRTIIRGGADDSYGIEVAKLAGVPDSIIKRAADILYSLENNTIPNNSIISTSEKDFNNDDDIEKLLSIEKKYIEIQNYINDININNLTPIEGMNILNKIKNKLEYIS
ncbi:MAG: DNA mismatch repair protein MutS [Oscillospiraceae bacterium]|nr:DNA mismatch repair protein MutS [Oscillospiraceae bacterium]